MIQCQGFLVISHVLEMVKKSLCFSVSVVFVYFTYFFISVLISLSKLGFQLIPKMQSRQRAYVGPT